MFPWDKTQSCGTTQIDAKAPAYYAAHIHAVRLDNGYGIPVRYY